MAEACISAKAFRRDFTIAGVFLEVAAVTVQRSSVDPEVAFLQSVGCARPYAIQGSPVLWKKQSEQSSFSGSSALFCPEGSALRLSAAPSACLLHRVGPVGSWLQLDGEHHSGRIRKNGATLESCCPCIGSGTESRSPGTGFCWQQQPSHAPTRFLLCHAIVGHQCHHNSSQLLELLHSLSPRHVFNKHQ